MKVAGLLKEAREATSKAESIENAVYDFKAVNPHRKAEVDRRTPAELLDMIEAKGREVAEALVTLRALTSVRPIEASMPPHSSSQDFQRDSKAGLLTGA